MENILNNRYNIIASLATNGQVKAFVGQKKENPEKNLLINEFDTLYKKSLSPFFSMNSQLRNKVSKDFSIMNDHFYIAFEYQKGSCICDKFKETINTYPLKSRIEMVENFLIELTSNSFLPLNIRLCSLEAHNLVVNSENEIKANYNLANISAYDHSTEKDLFLLISKMLNIVFNHEINILKSQHIKLVVDKCQHNLYQSIPELTVELKKAISKQNPNTLMLKIKHFNTLYKDQIKKFTRIGSIVAIAACITIVAYNLLNQKKVGQYFKIGNVEYNAALSDSKDNSVKITDKTQETVSAPIDLSIPSNTSIEFDDYIVKPNDTISSICSNCYSDQNFTSTIKSFNNITSDDDLVPGTILRIPNETLVKDYLKI